MGHYESKKTRKVREDRYGSRLKPKNRRLKVKSLFACGKAMGLNTQQVSKGRSTSQNVT